MKKPVKRAGFVAGAVAAKPAPKKKPPPAKAKKAHPHPAASGGGGFVAGLVAARGGPAKKAKPAAKAKKHPVRKLALGEGVACCSAEALAASLRLAGRPVSDDDVLALYWRTAADADAGATVLATLEAAVAFRLAGCRPVFAPASLCPAPQGAECIAPGDAQHFLPGDHMHALILGVDLPGPHAVLATADGWWSWGGLYDPAVFPDAVIEEAWTIEWEA